MVKSVKSDYTLCKRDLYKLIITSIVRLSRLSFFCISTFLIFEISDAQCLVFQNSESNSTLRKISFADSNNGFIIGYGTILKTTNRGSTWTSLPWYEGIPHELIDIWMLDSLRGILFAINDYGKSFLYRTTNGGNDWQFKGQFYVKLHAISFCDSLNGFIVGENGVILFTKDAGVHWWNSTSGVSSSLTCVASIDSLNSFVGCDDGKILVTTNGGITWTSRQLQIDGIGGICFMNKTNGTIVGKDGKILHTTDGGYNWDIQFSDPSLGTLKNISFYGENLGAVVGQNGIVITTNGGMNWYLVSPFCAYYQCNDIKILNSDNGFAVGNLGSIFVLKFDSCGSNIRLIYPPNKYENIPLTQTKDDYYKVTLRWGYNKDLNFYKSIVQISMDSSFRIIRKDFEVISYNDSVLGDCFFPGEKYFWRVGLLSCVSQETTWSPVWDFTTARASISGSVFEDLNKNGKFDEWEDRYLSDWPLYISGKISLDIHTNEDGRYMLRGLDTGMYMIMDKYYIDWKHTFPDTNLYVINLEINDSITNLDFGRCFPWNTVSGYIFYDRNENGTREWNEPGFANGRIIISRSGIYDQTNPNCNGFYNFKRISSGAYFVSLVIDENFDNWEVISPNNPPAYEINFPEYDSHIENLNFAVHPKPTRLKLTISVQDCTKMSQDILWGIRSGATYGIWGVDHTTTNIDFSEGELEIPPQFYGVFDARFVNPDNSTNYFGCGSYTDIRDFTSLKQIDTFRISYMPGYLWGGDYPITLRWSKQDIINSFNGEVVLLDKFENQTDMKIIDTLTIINKSVTSLKIISQFPNLPSSQLKKWRMISLPTTMLDNRPDVIFKPALPRAYSFRPSVGYIKNDTLIPGIGYWIKGATFSDSTLLIGNLIQCDTIQLYEGWNLINSIGESIPISNATPIPDGLINSFYFGFDSAYFVTDSLKPFNAYWVKSRGEGYLILSIYPLHKKYSQNINQKEIIARANVLNFRDAVGNTCKLYYDLKSDDKIDISFFKMPPPPPEELFDVRYESNQFIEFVDQNEMKEVAISIGNVQYPLLISWEVKSNDIKATLKINQDEVKLNNNDSYSIYRPVQKISLLLNVESNLPQEFSLMQNYPNPFNSSTIIKYNLPFDSRVKIKIYNILGQEIETLVDDLQEAGYKTVTWDGNNQSSGIYLYKLEVSGSVMLPKSIVQVKKMLMIK